MNPQVSIIIAREYLERVKRKSFIITTILMPLLVVGLMALPALLISTMGTDEHVVAVVDHSKVIAPALQSNDNLTFKVVEDATLDDLKSDEGYYGVLVIDADIVEKDSPVSLFTHSAGSIEIEGNIQRQISSVLKDLRLSKYEIPNIKEILEEASSDVRVQTYRLDIDENAETSSMLSYFVGLMMSFILYMLILLYGQMVMTSIIEEKNNRVLEIVVSSVKPFNLMLGKIVGIGLVAVTQIVVWIGLIIALSGLLLPAISSPEAMAEEPEMFGVISQLTDTGYMLSLAGYMLLFMIGGYLMYSSIYAAIGSSVDNIQDASQLQSIAMVPIILSMVCASALVADPSSPLAFWGSIIPFTSPVVMVARIPYGIPSWEIWVSIILLFATVIFMVWFAAKIYRVGIFMYGKKPSWMELMRWVRYK